MPLAKQVRQYAFGFLQLIHGVDTEEKLVDIIERTAPQDAAVVPVVVYLPGLGQSAAAGATWRAAWASAGYAVLAVQPLDDDALAWTSAMRWLSSAICCL